MSAKSSTIVTSHVITPHVQPGSHPIETGRYIISTPAINLLRESLVSWIENRAPGGCVDSPPRTGKTRAIRFTRGLLLDRFGSIPIFTMLCRGLKSASERDLFERMLKAVGHSLWQSGNANAKLHRLIEYLTAQVEESGQPRLIWFFDEAQKLHEPEYNTLIDVYNELDTRDIVPIFIMVGQHELLSQINAFKATGKTQILGRFMAQQCHFHGLRNASDVSVCLQAYDDATEFPVESECSFTAYFFPNAYRLSGFRLQDHADDLWEAFKWLRESAGLPGPKQIPMQYFCHAVEYVMKKHRTSSHSPRITPQIWKEAIKKTGYLNAERFTVVEEGSEYDA